MPEVVTTMLVLGLGVFMFTHVTHTLLALGVFVFVRYASMQRAGPAHRG